jgi:pyruvate,orthophosphate dikinase
VSYIWLGDTPDLDAALVGGKARSVNRMRAMNLPVPPAFVLSTACSAAVNNHGGRLTDEITSYLREGLTRLEAETGRRLGSVERPLLVSVRSGGARSMPGMMDTVLNLGMNGEVERALTAMTGDPEFAADTHRRYIEQFERVVGTSATGNPWQDLVAAAEAVFASWDSPRAKAYRTHHSIDHDGGTAVTVQAMVFGNFDNRSGTGVLFTRNPLTGDAEPYGEWLPRGQGEDVVSGRFDAAPLSDLYNVMPDVHDELLCAADQLERWGKDAQDIEFTVESGRLWLLQSRVAKRSPQAAVRIAVRLAEEDVLSRAEAVALVSDTQIAAATRPRVDPLARAQATVLATGEPACPGVATGRVVGTCDDAEDLADAGVDVVLSRPTTDPDDVGGMVVSAAVITEIGGATSHAAVVSRELGTPCVVGCGRGELAALIGRVVTVDGTTGEILDGAVPSVDGHGPEHVAAETLKAWRTAATFAGMNGG